MPSIEEYMFGGLSNMTYEELIDWYSTEYGVTASQIDDWCAVANQYDVSELSAVEELIGNQVSFTKTADGLYNVTGYDTVGQIATNTSLPNSNLIGTARSKFNTMLNRGKTVAGKLNITRYPASGSFAQKAGYIFGSVGSAVGAVSAGITLGKTIDSALYNLNPNFWDEHGMSSLDPNTWSSITSGDDSWQAGLFNFVFGIDPDTGNTQAYMDERAFALLSKFMLDNGAFQEKSSYIDTSQNMETPSGTIIDFTGKSSIPVYSSAHSWWYTNGGKPSQYIGQTRTYTPDTSSVKTTLLGRQGDYGPYATLVLMADTQAFTGVVNVTKYNSSGTVTESTDTAISGSVTTPYGAPQARYNANPVGYTDMPMIPEAEWSSNLSLLAYVLCYGNVIQSGGVDGIGNQTGATLPNTSDWSDVPSTLNSLKQQYPDLWNDALVWDNVQPDGSNPQLTYIPVSFPNINSYNDTQPTSSPLSQSDTLINVNTLPQTLIDTITKILEQPQTQPQTQTETTPQNPVDTGTGDTSSPILPVGSASALWSVYNPTQGQVDSFGAWLWSSPFETNIGKLFQNPIDGVITLHKVFATPDNGSAANIVVGTLDSGVSSATVPNQYTTVDCGSVDLYEYFGNVFDYPPFTNVSLYLPFIGIVPLDTNDVMRSTISVTYGVDVYTGACLAMVEVSRDGNTVNMYQYAGMCSVEYPITNVQHSQFISGVLAVASGVASVATAGIGAPAALAIAGGAATAAKANVGRSGSFSGNAGAMGIKNPYLIIQRPQTKVADAFPYLAGYPTNVSGKLSNFGGHVVVTDVHVEGMSATDTELSMIEQLLHVGVLV